MEENIEVPVKKEEKVVGIDLGVKSIVTTSDGKVYGNPDYLNKYERKIKGLQKGLSRKKKGSKNYNKYKLKIRETYRKMENARKKLVEEIVSEITKTYDIIVTETLNVKEMIYQGNKKLRKGLLNATFGLITRKLEYKCIWLNKTYEKVDMYFKSSQKCSKCGNIDKSMKDLSKRIYHCNKCNLEIDRDINASINIKFEGVRNYFKRLREN